MKGKLGKRLGDLVTLIPLGIFVTLLVLGIIGVIGILVVGILILIGFSEKMSLF
jgi:hypothetical protein